MSSARRFILGLMAPKPLPKSIRVVGRRWYNRSCGNTYHVADVYVDEELLGTFGPRYGYGEQYEQTAMDALVNARCIPKPDYATAEHAAPWRYYDKLGIAYTRTVYDVKRKRDL